MSKGSNSRAIGLSLCLVATAAAVLLLLVMAGPAKADPPEVFAQWNFESETTEPNVDLTGNAEADAGDGLGAGDFAGGYGSVFSWRFDQWSTGERDDSDYFQFKVDLSRYAHITLSFGEKRSNTGPLWMDVRYSTDCSSDDTEAIPGAVVRTDHAGWRAHSFDLGSGTPVDEAIRGQPEVCFRIYGYYAEGEDGTWQIDDVTFHAGEANALLISKSAPDKVYPNQVFTYTLNITNSTGVSTTGTTITDSVPANATFVPGSASDGGTLIGGTVISWTIPGDFEAGLTISRTFQVVAGGEAGLDIVNDAYAVTAADWPAAGAGAAVTTTIVAPALGVEKAGPEYAIIGESMVYTITATNAGNISATNVLITDRLPLSTTYLSDNSGVVAANPSAGVYAWPVGDLAAGAVHTFNLTATVGSSMTAGAVFTNEVEVSTDSPGDVPDNNIARWDSIALEAFNLTQSIKTVEPAGAVEAGDLLTYTIRLTNTGALDAAVTVTDTLPDGLFLVQGLDGGGLTWTGSVPAGGEVLLTLVVQADPALGANVTVSNLATIDDGSHPAFDVHSPETEIVVAGPTVSKAVVPVTGVLPGGMVTYTITLGNNSDALAQGIVMSDALPVELDFGGWLQQNGAIQANDLITWTGDITGGEQVTIIFTATVDASPDLYGRTITNTSVISHTTGGRSAEASFAMAGPLTLSFTKSVEMAHDPVYPGDPITYTIVITNDLGVDAAGVVVTDNLPLGVVGQDLAWSGTISAGQQVEFIIQATLTTSSAFLGETLVNTAYYACQDMRGSAGAAFTIVDAWRTYLPWMLLTW